ncbi:MAG: DUF302 domain-containing protein [Gallionella sp.]|nr:DUF302 domain-containing protein [Gallionella sp.]MDD4959756.1 DUF302 domain-containing protein [Gallionella sp.]
MRHFMLALALLFGFAQTAFAAPPALETSKIQVQLLRIQVADSVSFNDAVESLKLRANQLNIKYVGVNAIYHEIQALTGKPAKRMEIFNFCDGLTAQQMLAADLNTIAFMPCRISIVEDEAGKRWVIAMMMDDATIHALKGETRKNAERVMAALKEMMIAASSGDI